MKITRVEPILIRTPMQLDGTVPCSSGVPKTDVYTLLVRVDTSEGFSPAGDAFMQEPGLGKDPDLDIIERMRVA